MALARATNLSLSTNSKAFCKSIMTSAACFPGSPAARIWVLQQASPIRLLQAVLHEAGAVVRNQSLTGLALHLETNRGRLRNKAMGRTPQRPWGSAR